MLLCNLSFHSLDNGLFEGENINDKLVDAVTVDLESPGRIEVFETPDPKPGPSGVPKFDDGVDTISPYL